MECPKCGSETSVKDSRPVSGTIKRRRFCDKCPHRFTTYELVMDEPGVDALTTVGSSAEETLRRIAEKINHTADDIAAAVRLHAGKRDTIL